MLEYGFDQNGNPKVKLADQRGARDRLAKYLKILVDRHEVTGKDGAPLPVAQPIFQIVQYKDEDGGAAGETPAH